MDSEFTKITMVIGTSGLNKIQVAVHNLDVKGVPVKEGKHLKLVHLS